MLQPRTHCFVFRTDNAFGWKTVPCPQPVVIERVLCQTVQGYALCLHRFAFTAVLFRRGRTQCLRKPTRLILSLSDIFNLPLRGNPLGIAFKEQRHHAHANISTPSVTEREPFSRLESVLFPNGCFGRTVFGYYSAVVDGFRFKTFDLERRFVQFEIGGAACQ